MEGYTLRQQPLGALRGGSPLLRLASDERLIELTRRGQQSAFEALVSRYQSRLLAFCRHMLSSREDAEDVLQEVFAAAYNAILADARAINVRPWLYRIARNRSLNHLRRVTAIGVDSMDEHFADGGQSTSEKAHHRAEFQVLLDDIAHLPETQRTALVLREMDALSYEQIADAMDTTVPSVKSLLVRARIGLAEAAEARKLTCDEVRLELGAVAEGVASLTPPVRRHVKSCERCRGFRTQLRSNNKALAAIFPLGPMLLLKKTLLAKLGLFKVGSAGGGATAGGATAGGAAAGGATAAATGGATIAGGGLATAGTSFGGFAAGAVGVKAAVVVATMATVAVVAHNSKPALRIPPSAPVTTVASVPVAALPPAAYPQSEPGPSAGAAALKAPVRVMRPLGATARLIIPHSVARTTGIPDGAAMLAVEDITQEPATGATGTAFGDGTTTAAVGPATPSVDGTGSTVPTTQYLATTTTFSSGATAVTGPTGDTSTQEISTTTEFPAGATSSTTTQEITTTTAFPAGTTGATDPVGSTASVGGTTATGPTTAGGPTGATGTTGATGATSVTGASGATAATGPTGATSASGATGTTTATGPTGAASASGATGTTTATGPSGATGSTGVTGSAGASGGTGSSGGERVDAPAAQPSR